MNNIEVEVRALISKIEFNRLKKFFYENGKFLNHHKDATLYFDKDGRIRLRKEKDRTYFVCKSGKIHDKHREEMEIEIKKSDYLSAQKLLKMLDKPVEVKWQRERFVWLFQGVKAYLDNTKGYGMIFELEAITSPKNQDDAYQKMLKVFHELDIKPTPKEKIQKHYQQYLKNWKKLIK